MSALLDHIQTYPSVTKPTPAIVSNPDFTFAPKRAGGAVEVRKRRIVSSQAETSDHKNLTDHEATVILAVNEYNDDTIDDLELWQDSIDAMSAKAAIAAAGTPRMKWADFMAELEADGLLD